MITARPSRGPASTTCSWTPLVLTNRCSISSLLIITYWEEFGQGRASAVQLLFFYVREVIHLFFHHSTHYWYLKSVGVTLTMNQLTIAAIKLNDHSHVSPS